MFPGIGATIVLVVLVITIAGFIHPLLQQARLVFLKQWIPEAPQTTLMTFQPAPRKTPSSS